MLSPLGAGWFALGVCFVYLLVMFVLPDILPAKMTWDSNRLVDMVETGFDGEDSYAMTAKLFGYVPEPLLLPLIAVLGCVIIVWMCGSAATMRAQALVALLIIPLLVMGVLRPQKEVFVVALSVACAFAMLKAPKPWMALAAMFAIYGVYGGMVRGYFLLMPVVALGLMIAGAVRGWLLVLGITLVLAVVLMLPRDVYMALQGNRDSANMFRILGTEGNQTFFNNPWRPDDGFAFVGNYLYAALRLNVPVLFHLTPQAFFLLGTNIAYAALVWLMRKDGDVITRMMAALFMAHALVLWLFEPDLGSYLRHISSVALYLWPGVVLWQLRAGVEARPLLPRLPMPAALRRAGA